MDRCYGCGVDYAALAFDEPCPCTPPEVYILKIHHFRPKPRPKPRRQTATESPERRLARRPEKIPKPERDNRVGTPNKSTTDPDLLLHLETAGVRLGRKDGWVFANSVAWMFYNGNSNLVGMKLSWARRRGDVERSEAGPPYMWRVIQEEDVKPEEIKEQMESAMEKIAEEFVFAPVDDVVIERYRRAVSDALDWPIDGVEVEVNHDENGYVLKALLIPKTITVSIRKAIVDDENRS